jgi:tRNA (cmo5U34)-methyltransferase
MPDSITETHTPFLIPQNWTFKDDGVAAAFERHVREQLPWYSLATDAVAHVGRHYIPEFGRVYDLGCSTGNIGRALESTLDVRSAVLIPVEISEPMARHYTGPQRGNLVIQDIVKLPLKPFDLAVCFLTMMFVPVAERIDLMIRLRAACRVGGAIIVFDKTEATGGYVGTVLWRLALAGKVASGVPAQDIIAKELSLGGVQRPIDAAILGPDATEFFRFGEFAGWLIAP